MKPKLQFILVSFLSVLLFSCTTDIYKIVDHPYEYLNKEVTISGEVALSYDLIFLKFYEVTDQTGSVYVITKGAVPTEGKKVKVKGKVEKFAIESINYQGVVLMELDKAIKN